MLRGERFIMVWGVWAERPGLNHVVEFFKAFVVFGEDLEVSGKLAQDFRMILSGANDWAAPRWRRRRVVCDACAAQKPDTQSI